MSVLGAILGAVGSTALSSGQGALGYGINELFGVHKHAERRQLEQQDKLNALSYQWNKKQMDYAQQLEKDMYSYTFDMNKPEAIKNLIKKAGLNPGLMYGNSAGVSGATVGSPSGAGYNSQAANEADIIRSNMAITEMGLQMAKLKSEIDLNKSAANKNNADAGLSEAKTKTEDQVRDAFIANIFYEGKIKWFESIIHDIKLTWGNFEGKEEGKDYNLYWWNDKIYGSIGIPDKLRLTLFGDELRTAIEASGALRDNHIANTALTNEKTKYLYLEIMADIAQKKASAAESKAKELQALWSTGEYVNWKNILESSTEALNTIMKLVMSAAGM
ncbi:MAG: hypothetical protein QXW80_06480 [Candidatus Micrarchaeia archaeon]